MPFYVYECSLGHSTEELRKVGERHNPTECGICGKPAALAVQPVALDYAGMGLDPGFPTAYERWGKTQTKKNSGKEWDSNNRRYGGDWEKQK